MSSTVPVVSQIPLNFWAFCFASRIPPLLCLSYVRERIEVELFHFRPRPGSLAQELEAGFDAGVKVEAVHADALSQTFPAIVGVELGDDRFERDPVEGILGAGSVHDVYDTQGGILCHPHLGMTLCMLAQGTITVVATPLAMILHGPLGMPCRFSVRVRS